MNMQQPLNPAEVYERYLSRPIADPWTRVLLELAVPKRGDRVLDLACGTGSVARQVAPIVGTTGTVVAVDINADMLKVGGTQHQPAGAPIEWRQGDATHLDLLDDNFDLIFCQQGLQFFPDRGASVREMRRLLRTHGTAVISVWQSLTRHPIHEALFTATARYLDVPFRDVDVAFSFSSAEKLYTLLRSANFTHVEVTTKAVSIQMPEPERFVEFSILGVATSIPKFASLDGATRSALVSEVTKETHAVVQSFMKGDSLRFPMEANIAIAR